MRSFKSLSVLFIFFSIALSAQVGIGTTNPASDLDVVGDIQYSGEIKPAGDSGNAGEVLTSQGAGNPTLWVTATNALYDNFSQVFSSGSLTVSNGTFTIIPALTKTVMITGSAKVLITSDGGIMLDNGANNKHAFVEIAIHQDQGSGASILTRGGYKRIHAVNGNNANANSVENWSFSVLLDVTAGNYTWDVRASRFSGNSNVTVGGDSTSVLEGNLSILVIYE